MQEEVKERRMNRDGKEKRRGSVRGELDKFNSHLSRRLEQRVKVFNLKAAD